MSLAALLAFAVCALVDWVAVAQERTEVEYVAKPAALAALLVYALAGTDASAWLIAALTFSLLGDVYLMLPAEVFAAGLVAFLLAHLFYIAAFDASLAARLAWLVVMLVIAVPIALRIMRSVSQAALRAAIALYMAVITFMVASAMATGSVLAAVGALLFFASDGILAWNRFVAPVPQGRLVVIVTYHLGQLALATALRAG
jgi:uncharacterized membrane protein YhhN